MNKDLKKLRGAIDGNDKFIQGYQVGKAKTYARKVPAWAHNNTEIKKILLCSFPKLNTDKKQRAAASEWAQVIYLYFRLRYTRNQTAIEMGKTKDWVRRRTLSITRVSKGLAANGSGPRTPKRGRPRKSCA